MPYPLVKAAHFVGLALLLGGPVFSHIVWRERGEPRPAPLTKTGWTLFSLGLVLFLLTGYLDIVRAAGELWGELLPGDVVRFLFGSRYGNGVLAKSLLALLFAVATVLRPASAFGRVALIALGAGVIYYVSATSNLASTGIVGHLGDMVHVGALAVWGGGLFYFATAPWPRTGRSATVVHLGATGFAEIAAGMESIGLGMEDMGLVVPSIRRTRPIRTVAALARSDRPDDATENRATVRKIAAVSERFSVVGTVAVSALNLTGLFMATRLMYGLPALTETPYGMNFMLKLAAFAALSLIAAVNHFYFVPGLKRGREAERFVRHFRRAVRLEASLLLLILILTAFLTTQAPPKEAPDVLPPTSVQQR